MSEGTQTTQTTQATEPQGGGSSPAWFEREDIDQSLVSDKVKGFTNEDGSMNLPEFLKSYNSAQSYIGGAVKIPGENASEDEWSSLYARLGRPESMRGLGVPKALTSTLGRLRKGYPSRGQLPTISRPSRNYVSRTA